MQPNASPTELVTATTDLMMAAAGLIVIFLLWRYQRQSPWITRLWIATFSLFTVSAIAGAMHHGIDAGKAFYDTTWSIVFFSLGTTIALLVTAVSFDLYGKRVASRMLPVMIGGAFAFFFFSLSAGQDFRLFLAFEAAALVSALTGYTYLAARGEKGKIQMAIGMLVTIVAAIVQGTKIISLVPAYPFDHNAAFHLIQIIAVAFMFWGIRKSISNDLP